ncbi:MAG TPA: hypothetical protein VNZ01_03125 [Solirubrobacteraceae bacterium]|jgi:hypothetical protein|nr:hypothetical protein [Solirubrobacteraceae bacterium]
MTVRLSRITLPIAVAAVILLAQVGINIWQHFGEARYFAWAPNDYLVTYDLQVSAGGRSLTAQEIQRRYRLDLSDRLGELSEATKARLGLSLSGHYVFEDPPQELKDRIRRYEQSKGRNDAAHVRLVYQLDGGKEQTWLWPS